MITGNWNLDEKTENGWKTVEGFSRKSHAKDARKRLLAKKNNIEVEDLKSEHLGSSNVLVRKGW